MDIEDSWCDIQDDLIISSLPKQKELLESSGSIGLHKTNSKILVSKSSDFLSNGSNDPQLSIGEILSIDYVGQNLSEIDILKNQCYVASQLKKYTMSCKDNSEQFDVSTHLPKLEWLLQTSTYLAKKRNQRDIRLKKRQNIIQRNSYEFCNNNFKCLNTKCHQKHFVYNYVNNDISELIKYLQISKNESDTKEIYVTINTINFVFNHMYDELFNTLSNIN